MKNTDRTRSTNITSINHGKDITLEELELLCDDPGRDRPGGRNVKALLAFDPERGFQLAARDGARVHQVVDSEGAQVRFRTIEAALTVLLQIPGLHPEIGIFFSPSGRAH